RFVYAGLAVLAIVSVATFYLIRLNTTKVTAGEENHEVRAALPLWQDFLQSSQPVLVSFSNTMFEGTAEAGMKLLKPMASTPPNEALKNPDTHNKVITEHYTGIGEVMGVYALTDFFARANHAFRVKRSLLLTWDDFKTGNIVILGSPAENY